MRISTNEREESLFYDPKNSMCSGVDCHGILQTLIGGCIAVRVYIDIFTDQIPCIQEMNG